MAGGIGIANVMVIGVLERRSEIGLRRALGAARGHVAAQFLVESLLLAAIGGATGVAIGAAITVRGVSDRQQWAVQPPAVALWGGRRGWRWGWSRAVPGVAGRAAGTNRRAAQRVTTQSARSRR